MADRENEHRRREGDERYRRDYFGGDDIDYRWEGARRSDDEENDRTDRGYDDAAHHGSSRYGVLEGRGGVFGTSGGGTYGSGFQIVHRPGIYDRSGAPGPFEPGPARHNRYGRDFAFDEVMYTDEGPHAGKGPKGYRRSDERIVEDISERLMRHGHIDASAIEVRCENGEVTLSGEIDSRRAKRLAEYLAESVAGVEDVHNRLKIT